MKNLKKTTAAVALTVVLSSGAANGQTIPGCDGEERDALCPPETTQPVINTPVDVTVNNPVDVTTPVTVNNPVDLDVTTPVTVNTPITNNTPVTVNSDDDVNVSTPVTVNSDDDVNVSTPVTVNSDDDVTLSQDQQQTMSGSGNSTNNIANKASADGSGNSNVDINTNYLNVNPIDLSPAAQLAAVELCQDRVSGGLSLGLFNVFSGITGNENINVGFNFNIAHGKAVEIKGKYETTILLPNGKPYTSETEGSFTIPDMVALNPTQRGEVYTSMREFAIDQGASRSEAKEESDLAACLVDEYATEVGKINATYDGLAKNNKVIADGNVAVAQIKKEEAIEVKAIEGQNAALLEYMKHCTNQAIAYNEVTTTTGTGENAKTVTQKTAIDETIDRRDLSHGGGHLVCELMAKQFADTLTGVVGRTTVVERSGGKTTFSSQNGEGNVRNLDEVWGKYKERVQEESKPAPATIPAPAPIN
ncbi:MAG: hypothetical protein CMH26_02315 [Micavibrio sp.]|nr:hypothetical protein [Micavibrio sp.]|tara:strand:+ start:2304 stop:3731 length:1428 start_codon:yes stop_codon:yes gene_type:complete